MRTNKSKGDRFERQMAPMFQFGRAFVSDAPTEFLNHFKSEWMQFPLGIHDDCLDAVFWMMEAGKSNMYGLPDNMEMKITNPLFDKVKAPNPASLFGRK